MDAITHPCPIWTGWETTAGPLANASENLAAGGENRPGRVEFCIGYIRDYPVRASAKKFLVSQPVWDSNLVELGGVSKTLMSS